MKKVLLMPPLRESDVSRFSDIEGYLFFWSSEPSLDELADVEIILGNPPVSVLQSAGSLKWLQTLTAGVDVYLKSGSNFPENVCVTNLSGVFGQSISEFVLALTLTLMKGLQLYRDNQGKALWRDEGWQLSPVGKNLLIVGAGNIGCETARLFQPFSCHITGVRKTVREKPDFFDEMIPLSQLDTALADADIVVCALPSTPETDMLFDKRRLSLLKPDSVFINVGRGSLVDCDALAELLEKGSIRGAALDVTNPEPLPEDHPLWKCPNAVITPHITGGTFGHLEATENAAYDLCRENLRRYLAGETLLNLVNFSYGYRTTENRY